MSEMLQILPLPNADPILDNISGQLLYNRYGAYTLLSVHPGIQRAMKIICPLRINEDILFSELYP